MDQRHQPVSDKTAKLPVYIACEIPVNSTGYQLLVKKCDVRAYDGEAGLDIARESLLKTVVGVQGLVVDNGNTIDKKLIDVAGPQLKVISTYSVGYEHIDLEECRRRNISVGYVGNVQVDSVSEHAIALTLATARRFKQGFREVGCGDNKWGQGLYLAGKTLTGSTVGMIGLGRIGFATARKFSSFGVSRILYYDRTRKDYANEIHAEFVSFETVLEMSDFVIATCSLNEKNRGLFDAAAFQKMKPSAIFINMSRGMLVNQDDLVNALQSEQIYAAGLDVTTPEPLPLEHPLLSLSNCTITPHIGSATERTKFAMAEVTARNVLAGLKGEPLYCPIPI